MMYGYGFDGGASWLWMGLMMLFGLLATVGVILLIVWLARGTGGQAGMMMQPPVGGDQALDVARRRYATGEITKEQYEEIVRTLR